MLKHDTGKVWWADIDTPGLNDNGQPFRSPAVLSKDSTGRGGVLFVHCAVKVKPACLAVGPRLFGEVMDIGVAVFFLLVILVGDEAKVFV